MTFRHANSGFGGGRGRKSYFDEEKKTQTGQHEEMFFNNHNNHDFSPPSPDFWSPKRFRNPNYRAPTPLFQQFNTTPKYHWNGPVDFPNSHDGPVETEQHGNVLHRCPQCSFVFASDDRLNNQHALESADREICQLRVERDKVLAKCGRIEHQNSQALRHRQKTETEHRMKMAEKSGIIGELNSRVAAAEKRTSSVIVEKNEKISALTKELEEGRARIKELEEKETAHKRIKLENAELANGLHFLEQFVAEWKKGLLEEVKEQLST